MNDQNLPGVPQLSWKQCLLLAAAAVLLWQWAWSGNDPKVTMLAFKDDPASFKGKTVSGKMSYSGRGGRLANDVRTMEAAFLRAPFVVFTEAGVFDMKLLIPQGLEGVPQAGVTDYLLVTFKCNTGELDDGNIVASIRRE